MVCQPPATTHANYSATTGTNDPAQPADFPVQSGQTVQKQQATVAQLAPDLEDGLSRTWLGFDSCIGFRKSICCPLLFRILADLKPQEPRNATVSQCFVNSESGMAKQCGAGIWFATRGRDGRTTTNATPLSAVTDPQRRLSSFRERRKTTASCQNDRLGARF